MASDPTSGSYIDHEHRLPVRVYYEDTDFTGVVYHANYLRFFERGRSEFLRLMGPPAGMDDPGAFAVTRIEIDFKSAARIHDALTVRTAFLGTKGARLTFDQRIDRGGTRLCQALVTAVPIQANGKVRRPSDAELELWARHQRPVEG
jgi:acyl-CoA thioester hydrolase